MIRDEKEIMEVLVAPNEKLRVKTKPVKKVTPELLKITSQMIRMTKTFKDPEGVGLASTQIGRDERFFVAILDKKEKHFSICFNPEITSSSKKAKVFFEGCLSIPNIYGETQRPIWVKVKYQDQNGNWVNRKLTGLAAWVFQHEVDHLNGSLFMDRVLSQQGKVYKAVGRDRAGSEVFEEVKL